MDIRAHGGIEGVDSAAAAEANVRAIHRASISADDNTVYLPAGTWFVGDPTEPVYLSPKEERGAAGLSFVGDGPERSFLVLSEAAVDPDRNTWIDYTGSDHPDISWRNLTFDGNTDAILDPETDDGRIFFFTIDSQESQPTLSFENFRLRNIHSEGIKGDSSTGFDVVIDRCTLRNIGLERANQTDASSINHVLTKGDAPGDRITITNSKVELTSGNVVDIGTGSGDGGMDVTIRNCYMAGIGDALLKEAGTNSVTIERVFHAGNTEELDANVTQAVQDRQLNGRQFVKQISGTDQGTTYTFNDVEACQFQRRAIQLRDGYSWRIQGGETGPLKIHTVNLADRDPSCWRENSDSDSTFEFDFGAMSIHDVDGQVFRCPDSSGTIDRLHRSDNTNGLGDTGAIAISEDNAGAEPLDPDVPGPDDVGINTGGNDDEDAEPEAPLYEDWTPRWDSSTDDWGVVSGSEYAGGHALVFENDAGDRVRYTISCDRVGEPGDVEVLDRFRVPEFNPEDGLGFHARSHLRSGSRVDGSEDGYWIELEDRADAFRLAKYTDGHLSTLAHFGEPVEDAFFYRRFRAIGDEIKAKIWRADEEEPDDWDIVVHDGDHESGWVGLGSFDPELVETDAFSVATDGGTASLPEPSSVSLQVETVGATDVDDDSATVVGELSGSELTDPVSGYFRVREAGSDSWTTTEATELDSFGEFEAGVTGLESETGYEIAAVVDADEQLVTGETLTFTTERATEDDDEDGDTQTGTGPVVEAFEVTDESDSTWTRYDVDWTVSDEDGTLDTIVTKLRQDGTTVKATTTTVSGDRASYAHIMRVRGDVDEVVLTVTDTENRTNTVSESV